MMTRIAFLTVFCLITCRPWLFSMESPSPASFNLWDVEARPAAMGGAYVSLAHDANALAYNPAGLGSLTRSEALVARNQNSLGVTQEYAAVAVREPFGGFLRQGSGLGLMIHSTGVGKVRRTTLSDPRGDGQGTFSVRNLEIGAGLAKSFPAVGLSFGTGFKWVRDDLGVLQDDYWAADIGVMGDLHKLFNISGNWGVSVMNLGPTAKYGSKQDRLPVIVRLGASYRFSASGVGAFDLVQGEGLRRHPHLGLEYTVLTTLALRIGYTSRGSDLPGGIVTTEGITAGAGVTWRRMALNCSFAPYGDRGEAFGFSVGYGWP